MLMKFFIQSACPSLTSHSETQKIIIFLVFLLSHTFFALAAGSERPAPVIVPPASNWLGYDGSWSPVSVRVGTPSQWVEVIPRTGSSETWVIGQDGCDSTFVCRQKRGGLFLANGSSTWLNLGRYDLGRSLQLGDGVGGTYGSDTLAVNDQIRLTDQIIAIVNTTDWWLGSLGLGITEINFTEENKLSFISTLSQKLTVPSQSYGYTAGAHYQLKGVPSSLTIGGVDKNRFIPNDATFSLSPEKLPVAGIKSIKVAVDIDSSRPLRDPALSGFDNSTAFIIDSSTPFFWFPEELCDSFASKLGLVYNDTLSLYTYGPNETRFDELVNMGLDIIFTLSDLPSSGKSVDITLPFSAFDHKLSYPFPGLDIGPNDEGLRYFPLRRTNNSRQFTLGRAFLQEAYLTVDYERLNFSLAQAKFTADSGVKLDIVEIVPPSVGPSAKPEDGEAGRHIKVKVGIILGTCVAVFVICLCSYYYWRRSRDNSRSSNLEKSGTDGRYHRRWAFGWKFWRSSQGSYLAELPADKRHPVEAAADSSAARYELASGPVYELEGTEVGRNYEIKSPEIEVAMGDPREHGHHLVHSVHPVSAATNPMDAYPVSPIAPSSTQGASILTQSLGIPSPISPFPDHSTSGSCGRTEGSLSSQLLPGRTLSDNPPVYAGVRNYSDPHMAERTPPPRHPDRPLTRKFSWED
ncbi:hypothetical protein FQN57_002559 [Myotisia sp. PD_48]|nr:hypothetical protein FQN57_002559 [Myotisia sp. PD_48]